MLFFSRFCAAVRATLENRVGNRDASRFESRLRARRALRRARVLARRPRRFPGDRAIAAVGLSRWTSRSSRRRRACASRVMRGRRRGSRRRGWCFPSGRCARRASRCPRCRCCRTRRWCAPSAAPCSTRTAWWTTTRSGGSAACATPATPCRATITVRATSEHHLGRGVPRPLVKLPIARWRGRRRPPPPAAFGVRTRFPASREAARVDGTPGFPSIGAYPLGRDPSR